MLDLRPCPSCRRHVVVAATACPFCAAALAAAEPPPDVPIGAFSRAAVFAGLALASPACWTGGGNQPATTTGTQTTQTSTQTDGTVAPAPEGNKPDVTTARLEGVVTNSRTGQALVGYAVSIRPRTAAATQATATDASGHYAFAKLPAGEYVLQFGQAMPRRPPTVVSLTLHVGEAKRHDQAIFIPEPSNVPMPYGAPPARERIV